MASGQQVMAGQDVLGVALSEQARMGGECVFRPKPDTDSGASRSLIPVQADHLFRSNPITDSAGKPITFVGASGIGRAGRAEGAGAAG